MSALGGYDYLLMVVVSLQALAMAYLYHPKWKAFILSLPIPFTCASLALGHPIDATNVLGLTLLLGFVHGIRVLYNRFQIPIVISIAVCSLAYCGLALALAKVVSKTGSAFWTICVGSLLLAGILF